jgi:hypothetical protein
MSIKLNVAANCAAQLPSKLVGIVLVPFDGNARFPAGCKVPDWKEIACAT